MESRRLSRRLGVVAGGAAIIAMGAFTAGCGTSEKESPSSTTTTTTTTSVAPTSSAGTPAPTEKQLDPNGGNLFTPTVLAPPAPTAPPGVHRNN
jgi:hypothetical protein